MAKAAEAYLHAHDPGVHCGNAPSSWPFDPKYWKPSVNPIRNLVKAGALIAAEIERLQRAQNP